MARFGPIGNSDLSVIKIYLPSFAPQPRADLLLFVLLYCLFAYFIYYQCDA